jgi:PAS domain S-box-containing protein
MIENKSIAEQPIANRCGLAEVERVSPQQTATFESIFNALPDAVVFTDIEGQISLVTAAFVGLLGYRSEDVIGKPIDILYAAREGQGRENIPVHEHPEGAVAPLTVEYSKKDHGIFIGETVVTAVKDAEGHVLGLLHVIRDISERKQVEALFQENLSRLAKKHRYESIVSTVAHSVHQSTNLQAVLDNAVEAMHTYIERIDSIEIFLVDGEEAVLRAHTGLPEGLVERIQRLPAPQGYTWKVIRDGKPRYCADVDQDSFIHPSARAFGFKSYLSMPITADGETVGAVNINSLQGSPRKVVTPLTTGPVKHCSGAQTARWLRYG